MITNIPSEIVVSGFSARIAESDKSNMRCKYYDLAVCIDLTDEKSDDVVKLIRRLRLTGYMDKTPLYYNIGDESFSIVLGQYYQIPTGIMHAFLTEINKLYFNLEAKTWELIEK